MRSASAELSALPSALEALLLVKVLSDPSAKFGLRISDFLKLLLLSLLEIHLGLQSLERSHVLHPLVQILTLLGVPTRIGVLNCEHHWRSWSD